VRVEVVPGERTSELRRSVLRPAWAPGTPMHGDEEPEALHLAALTDDDAVVGACVLFPRADPERPDVPDAWQLRGMATAPALRGQGIGAAVVAEAVRQVSARGGRLLWCEARIGAVDFYARHGFAGDGETFLHAETGIEHLRMRRELIAGPTPSKG
jgi:predicted GNAT family N-acyltransferase